MLTLKASWQVRAGLFPGTPMHEHSKTWHYTSDDHEKDGNRRGLRFEGMREKAHAYAASLETGCFNWATVEYIWF